VLALALAGLVLLCDKFKGEVQMWQTNALLLVLLALALRWLDSRPALAGAALGFAFNVKYLPLPLLPYLLLRRRWRAAGWFAASALAFALLPAAAAGWGRNLAYQAVAYRGLLGLFGAAPAAPAAHVEGIGNELSVSVTSGLARRFASGAPGAAGFLLAGLAALACLALAGWMYRRAGLALLYRGDGAAPWGAAARALTAVEFSGLVAATLAFSPQTNSRHLVLLLPALTAAAALLLYGRLGAARWPLLVGTLLLTLGLVLPPGGLMDPALHAWREVGGPCWCVLPMTLALLGAGLRQAADR
jgi:hypothetical protein